MSSGIPQNQLNISDSTALAANVGGAIGFSGNYSGTSKTTFGSIEGNKENGTSGQYGGYLRFNTRTNGSANTERMRINSVGRLLVGTTAELGNNAGGGLDVSGLGGGQHVIHCRNMDTSGGANQIRFLDGSGNICGEINSNATNNTTAYGTSSDGRYKDVIGEAKGLEIINSLNPVKFTWKSSGEEDEGLIAQEVLKIVPNAVTGSEETKYMMDYSKLVTPLIKAIQEQQTIIEDLKTRIETLEG